MKMQRCARSLFIILSLSIYSGCKNEPATVDSKKPASGEATTKTTPDSTSTKEKPKADSEGPFVLGDLVKKFDPPPLEELEKKVEWVPMPVVDSLELLRKKQADEKPLVDIAEALKLKNDSNEANAKILSALGRLPADDKQVNWDAMISRHAYGDVKSTNPILSSSVVESDVNGLTSFGLFSFDWNLNPFASKDAVASWHASKDKMYDKVVLRDDLTWSDGHPITAHDVAFSFLVIMSSKVPVFAQRSGTDKIKWVHAYDDRTLVFFHKDPLATNVWNVNFSIIPKHVYEHSIAKDPSLRDSPEHVKLEDNPICGGSYTITKRIRGQELVLERRESSYMHNGKQVRDKPYFKTIRFLIRSEPAVTLISLKGGDLDEIILNPDQYLKQTVDDEFYKRNTKAKGTEWTEFHFLWNTKSPLFSDKRVRKALAYAFDHEELLSKLRYGLDEPCTGIFHPTSKWYPKGKIKPFQRDVKKAEQLLEDADWVDHDGDGIRDKMIDGKKVNFEFSVLVTPKQDRVDICNLLRQNLDEIGIVCTIQSLEFPVLIEKMEQKKFQAAFGGWGAGADPDTSDNIWGTGKERNYGNYSNPEVDRLFAQGRAEFDDEKRPEYYQKIQELIFDDQPYMWLFYQNSYYAFNKELRGYMFSPRGPYHYGPGFSSIWRGL